MSHPGKIRFPNGGPPHKDHIPVAGKPGLHQPEVFPHQTPGTIPLDGVTHLFSAGKPYPVSSPGLSNDEGHQGRTLGLPPVVDDLKIPVFPEPMPFIQGKNFLLHVKKAAERLLRRQRFTAFSTPAGDDVATGMGLHPAAETMYLFPLSFLWLIGLKHV